jgi:pimeloyl-ACP methyl ester carboxylesterase
LTLDLSAADKSKKSKLRRPILARYTSYLVIVTMLVLVYAAALGFRVMRAASLMYGMTYSTPPLIVRVYSKAFKHVPVTTDIWIQGRRGPLEIRVMTPKDLPNAPIIVLVHGFAPNGIQDALLNAFGQRLSRSGLKVVMPDIVSEQNLRIDRNAVTDVDDAIRWSAKTSGQEVSAFGISFSGGLVISATANPEFADYVKTTFCVSGYNSIARVGRYYLHEDVRGPDGNRYVETSPRDALALIAFQYLNELVPSEDVVPIRDALRTILYQRGIINADVTASLTAPQRALLDDLLDVRTQAMRERYHAVLERHRAEWDYISPTGKINKLHGSLYVLHGYGDQRIPTEEADWTRAEAEHKSNVKVVISSWINHSVLVPHTSFWEKLRVMYFVSQMFDEALHPVPLPATKG